MALKSDVLSQIIDSTNSSNELKALIKNDLDSISFKPAIVDKSKLLSLNVLRSKIAIKRGRDGSHFLDNISALEKSMNDEIHLISIQHPLFNMMVYWDDFEKKMLKTFEYNSSY